jgi:hypothetical protein
MFNLICISILWIIGSLVFLLFGGHESNSIVPAIITIFVISGLWLIGAIVFTFCSYDLQQERFEKLRGSLKNMAILEEKSTKLLEEFKSYLGKIYPELEKEIFSKIADSNSSDKLKIILTKYPEIKSSKVFIKLSKRMESVIGEQYKLKMDTEEDCATIRYNAKCKWEIIRPNIPLDIHPIVYSPLPASKPVS